jgi:hypothetical protein
MIGVRTREIAHRWPEVDSGGQRSSIGQHHKPPSIAVDPENQ